MFGVHWEAHENSEFNFNVSTRVVWVSATVFLIYLASKSTWWFMVSKTLVNCPTVYVGVYYGI